MAAYACALRVSGRSAPPAEQFCPAPDAGAEMQELALTPPTSACKSHMIMGKTSDLADPDGYVASFPIRQG